MLTLSDFEALAVGDMIETVPLFPALSDEKALLRTTTKSFEKADFVVTYQGVTLGKWTAERDTKGGLKWLTN